MSRALPLLLAVAGCAPQPRSSEPNVVLVVMDTVRVDHLGAYGYERDTTPFLDELVTAGTRFDRAWSTSSWTLPAHASMFTGLLPRDHGATQQHLKLRGKPALLAEQLRGAGYQCAGFTNNPWVSSRTGLEAGFEHFEELWRASERPFSPLGDPSSTAVRRWLEGERDPERPFFLFVNLMEAHGPYEPGWRSALELSGGLLDTLTTHHRYRSVGELGLVRSWYLGDAPLDPRVLEAARELYDAELRDVDAAVARIVRAVDEVSDPATTTVVVVTDHGESFGEHGHVGHAFNVYEPLLRVAAVARGPGFEAGAVESRPVQLTDVYSTLLGVAGVELGPGGEGRDWRALSDEPRTLTASYAFPEQVLDTFPPVERDSERLDPHRRSFGVALDGRFKLIRDSNGREELYDLLNDPAELEPIEGSAEGRAEPLRRAIGRVNRGKRAPEARLEGLDGETEAALRELGYLE